MNNPQHTSIELNGYIWTLDENNNKWIWKANESKIFTAKRVLKPKYQELPAFKAVNKIEAIYVANFNTTIEDSIKRMSTLLMEQHDT